MTAVDEVSLSAGGQTALSILQKADGQQGESSERLSSGLKVNNAVDDAQAFFLAKNLNNRAADLQAVKDDIGQAASSIGAAQNGIEAISNLSGQLQGIATAARGGSAQDRAAAAEQFDSIRQQIDNLARDAGFNGVNLIASTPSSHTVSFNESGSSDLTITGGASDSASLGINDATVTNNNFATDADIENAIRKVEQAQDSLRATSARFGSDIGILNARADFTNDQVNILRDGADKLVNADLTEEAAKKIALQNRSGLASAGLNVANDSQSAMLDLF
jgi:flagellin